MSKIILDCSAVAGWCFKDEQDHWSIHLLDYVVEHGASVPSHWHLEVSNMLLQAVKRKRTKPTDVTEKLRLFSRLPIEVDAATSMYAFQYTTSLAQTHSLTSYDAAYLELAMRLGLPLATKDEDLKKACKRLGVKLS